MCGICGVLAFNDSFAYDERVLIAMRDTMTHRGPDDAGVWHSPSGRVILGHRRLSIVDVSYLGHQPMSNEDGSVWVTFNGEIYNHATLRSELESRGHRYRSHCDTETIVHLYEEEGERCVERLDGMFAIAIWDERRREMFLARDRLGKKPLYWTRTPAGFAFASEIKALLRHPAVSADLDVEAFHDYLTFVCTPAPSTMFAGINKLSASERMTVGERGDIRADIYWTPMHSHAKSSPISARTSSANNCSIFYAPRSPSA
jgi:asparagine synthase (glutamine-hydrolysing)